MVIGNQTSATNDSGAGAIPAEKPTHARAFEIAAHDAADACFKDAMAAIIAGDTKALAACLKAATVPLPVHDAVALTGDQQISFAPPPIDPSPSATPEPRARRGDLLTAAVSTETQAAPPPERAPATGADQQLQKQLAEAQQALTAPAVPGAYKVQALHFLAQSGVGTADNPLPVADRDGNVRNYVIEEEQVGNRTMVHLFSQDDQGQRHVVLRGVVQADGSVQQERDEQGRFVTIEGTWWKQNMADRTPIVSADAAPEPAPRQPNIYGTPGDRPGMYGFNGAQERQQTQPQADTTGARRPPPEVQQQYERPPQYAAAPRRDGSMPFRHYGETPEEYYQRMGRQAAPVPQPQPPRYQQTNPPPRYQETYPPPGYGRPYPPPGYQETYPPPGYGRPYPPPGRPYGPSMEPGYRQPPRGYQQRGPYPPPYSYPDQPRRPMPPPYAPPYYEQPHRHRQGEPYPPGPYRPGPYERPPQRRPYEQPIEPVRPGDIGRDNPAAAQRREQLARVSSRIGHSGGLGGYCARGVREALGGVGINVDTGGDAVHFGKNLLATGKFIIVPGRPEDAQRGDIVIRNWMPQIQAGRGHNWGDVFVAQGDGTGTSDGVWRRIHPDGELFRSFSGNLSGYDHSYILRYVGG